MFGFGRRDGSDEYAEIPLFAGCSRDELRSLSSLSTNVGVAKGSSLCRFGEVGREVFVILDGAVDVRVDGLSVATLGTGDILGEVALLTNSARTADAVVTEDARVLVLSKLEFNALLNRHPRFVQRFLEPMSRRVRVGAGT